MWLYTPCPSAPEAADSILESALPVESVASSLASSVTWRGKPTPPKSWLRVCKTASWTTRLFGRISKPLTLARGAERWISSLPDIRVRDSPTLASGAAPLTPVTSGHISPRSSEQLSLGFASLKTSTAISPSDSEKSDKTWKKWVTGLRQSSLARRKLAQRICASGCSSWPSPQTPGGGRSVSEQVAASKGQTPDGRKVTVGLESAVRLWPTPRTITGGGESAKRKQELGRTESGGGDLQAESTAFSLPPQTTSAPGPASSPDEAILPLLCRTWTDRALRKLLRLNPSFVEWLMNWPPGWASLGPIDRNDFNYWAMASSRQVRLLLSAYSQEGLG